MPDTQQDEFGVRVSIGVDIPESLQVSARTGARVIAALQTTLMKYGRMLQKEAVLNASGRNVEFNGATFKINRVSGNLVRNIHSPVARPLAVQVVADAKYAAAVEAGHPPIDLKKTMAGKIVPLPIKLGLAQSAQALMPLAGVKVYSTQDSRGNPVTTGDGLRIQSKYASTGKKTGQRAVLFRRVPATGSGWIIPMAPPRPFMGAAAATVQPLLEQGLVDAFISKISVKE